MVFKFVIPYLVIEKVKFKFFASFYENSYNFQNLIKILLRELVLVF
jgi:hypothetical protein